MHEGHWNLLRTRRARWYGIAVLVVLFVLARFSGDWIETEWLYYRSRYDSLDPDNLRAIVIRMSLLLIGPGRRRSRSSPLVPRTKTWFSALGGATLVVYLFHGFVVLGAEFAGFKGWAADHWPLSPDPGHGRWRSALALFLAWKPVSSRLNVFVDPIGTFTRRRARLARSKASRSGPQLGVTALNGTTSSCARPLTGRGVAAEVGGVPGGHLARSRPVVRAAAGGPRAGR